jgi:hypothetical protein
MEFQDWMIAPIVVVLLGLILFILVRVISKAYDKKVEKDRRRYFEFLEADLKLRRKYKD